jgi:hypothetical protein
MFLAFSELAASLVSGVVAIIGVVRGGCAAEGLFGGRTVKPWQPQATSQRKTSWHDVLRVAWAGKQFAGCQHGEVDMKLLAHVPGMHDSESAEGQRLMCPVCGQSGRPAEEVDDGEPAFLLVGEDHGSPVRKCYLCGSGFLVRGENTEAVPAERWSQIESDYEALLLRHGHGVTPDR